MPHPPPRPLQLLFFKPHSHSMYKNDHLTFFLERFEEEEAVFLPAVKRADAGTGSGSPFLRGSQRGESEKLCLSLLW